MEKKIKHYYACYSTDSIKNIHWGFTNVSDWRAKCYCYYKFNVTVKIYEYGDYTTWEAHPDTDRFIGEVKCLGRMPETDVEMEAIQHGKTLKDWCKDED